MRYNMLYYDFTYDDIVSNTSHPGAARPPDTLPRTATACDSVPSIDLFKFRGRAERPRPQKSYLSSLFLLL